MDRPTLTPGSTRSQDQPQGGAPSPAWGAWASPQLLSLQALTLAPSSLLSPVAGPFWPRRAMDSWWAGQAYRDQIFSWDRTAEPCPMTFGRGRALVSHAHTDRAEKPGPGDTRGPPGLKRCHNPFFLPAHIPFSHVPRATALGSPM